jgi:hypothetical protein
VIGALAALLLQASIADLGWLSGRWLTETDGRWTEEAWSAPRAGIMLGFSRSGRGEALGEWELLRIAPGDDGALAYLAQPGGRPPVAFRLAAHDAASATFENPAHDFPQRIHYVREGDVLTATISRLDGSNAISWSYRRQ